LAYHVRKQRTSDDSSTAESGDQRPRVFYVSYDGMGEPLGRSQVLAYLFRLAREYRITLLSFEKPDSDLAALHSELSANGIEWRPLRYHRRPPVLSTVFDVWAGRRAMRSAARRGPPAIVHVRSYVPALIAMTARGATGGSLLFDIRGFWADERVEGGLWAANGLLYRLAKRCERRFFAQADAVVTLTHASVPQVRSWLGPGTVPVVVIPTCVELDRFVPTTPRADPHAVWCGSVGTWYRFDLAVRLASALDLPFDVLTRQVTLARRVLGSVRASVRTVAPADVQAQLVSGDIGLCMIRSSFSKVASAPTRFAEYLAAGMPVVVTPGVGDLEALVQEHGVGVVLRDEDDTAVRQAADLIKAMARDASVQHRCRQLAAAHFDVDDGARRYAELYRRLAMGSTPATDPSSP
jgi:glycosyltransferase involved in cell wall biosynthesis